MRVPDAPFDDSDHSVVGWICTADALVGGMILMLILALTTAGTLARVEADLARAEPTADLSATIMDLERRLAERERRIAELEADLERLARAREDIDIELARAKSDLEDLRAKLARTEAERQDLRASLVRSESEREGLRSELEQAMAKIALLERRVEELEASATPGVHQELLGIKGKLNKVAIVLDHSGSMNLVTAAAGNTSRWQYCLGIVKTWARHLEMDECILIVFSDGVQVYPKPKPGGPATFATEGEVGRKELEAILDRLPTPTGGTNTLDALERALAIPGLDSVILFTDGKPETSDAGRPIPTQQLQQAVYDLLERSRATHQIPINTVGLGDYFKPELSSFLMRVSELTGGVFIGR